MGVGLPYVSSTSRCLTDRAPRHRNENPALHRLDEGDGLMDCLGPPFDAPRLLTANLALFQVGILPQVVYCVEVTDLDEPCAHAFHHLPTRIEAPTPVGLPFQKVARVQRVRSELK